MKTRAKSRAASKAIRVWIRKGRMEPIEALDLPEAAESAVTIPPAKPAATFDPILNPARAWKDSIDTVKLVRQIYRDHIEGGRPMARPRRRRAVSAPVTRAPARPTSPSRRPAPPRTANSRTKT